MSFLIFSPFNSSFLFEILLSMTLTYSYFLVHFSQKKQNEKTHTWHVFNREVYGKNRVFTQILGGFPKKNQEEKQFVLSIFLTIRGDSPNFSGH